MAGVSGLRPSHERMEAAGVTDRAGWSGRFALLTTAPNADVADIHNRMPVTLRSAQVRGANSG